MTIAHCLVLDGGTGPAPAPHEEALNAACRAVAGHAGVERLDLYTPAAFDNPHTDDGAGPVLTVQTAYRDVEALEAGLASPAFADLLARAQARFPDAGVVHDALQMRFYPVAAESAPREWTAPISYVVRYHGPAGDPDTFIDFYTRNHPPIQGRFPGIRNVMCYLPVRWHDPTGLARADYLIGNEVVFDSIAALRAALCSPVLQELLEDSKKFPDFHGYSTHFPMRRARLS